MISLVIDITFYLFLICIDLTAKYKINAFNSTSRYLDDISNINNIFLQDGWSNVYPSELQLNKANTSNT